MSELIKVIGGICALIALVAAVITLAVIGCEKLAGYDGNPVLTSELRLSVRIDRLQYKQAETDRRLKTLEGAR